MKENRKSNKSFPCVEMVENMELYPYISKFSVYLPIFINIHVCWLVLLCSWLYLKSNGYIFRGRNCHFYCCHPCNWGHLIEKRICSHWSKFFPLRVDPFFGKTSTSRKANRKSRTLYTFENTEKYPYTLSLQKEPTHIVQTCWSEYLVVE